MTKMILGICRNPAQRRHSQGTNWLLAQAKQIPHLEASSKARLRPCWRHSHQSATTFGCRQTSSGSLGRSRYGANVLSTSPSLHSNLNSVYPDGWDASKHISKCLQNGMRKSLPPISVKPHRHREMLPRCPLHCHQLLQR